MGDLIMFNEDGKAEIILANGEQAGEIVEVVIYCDLCNEPLAISPVENDEVFLQCLRCHAVSNVAKTKTDEPVQEV